MDKYEKFIANVLGQTRQGSLVWDVDSPGKYFDYIFNSQLAFRCFTGLYTLNKQKYLLLLVEKKAPNNNNDFDIVIETHALELIVLCESKIVFTITENHVSRDSLIDLLDAVEQVNESSKKLFDSFE